MKNLLRRHRQILFFIVAGGLSAVIEVGSFKIFSVYLPQLFAREANFHGLHYPLSNVLSTACGIISNYFFSIWFVFERGRHSRRREFAYFMGISAVSTFVSLLIFQFFYSFIFRDEAFDMGFFTFSAEMLSKTGAILVVASINYTVKKRIIFNN